MGISSPSLLTPYSSLLTTPPDLNLPLPLSFSFLFHPSAKGDHVELHHRRREIASSSTTGEGRSRRAPPPQRGSRSSETSSDLVRSRRIRRELASSRRILARPHRFCCGTTFNFAGPDPVQIYLHKLLNGIDLDQTIPIVDPTLARRWIALRQSRLSVWLALLSVWLALR
uniref:Uncharacterized protein n=1 Tax=Fagus sylvatica TaxID=28930 RepID=A0A2N9GBA2_FAGSY